MRTPNRPEHDHSTPERHLEYYDHISGGDTAQAVIEEDNTVLLIVPTGEGSWDPIMRKGKVGFV